MSDPPPPPSSPDNGSNAARPGFFGRWGVWLALLTFATVLMTDVPEGMTPGAHKTLAITALTAALWFTGAIPLGAASLVPLVAFPLCGVLDVGSASEAYINKLVFLYLGGFLLALGLERWNVHERLALHTLRLTGTSPRRVVAGFMLAAAGLSMWISNTAATIMLLPVAVAMLDALTKGEREGVTAEAGAVDRRKLTVALLLGLAWAASIGGIATPIGTPTNIAFIGAWQESFPEASLDRFSFDRWIVAFAPVSIVLLLLAWGLLTWNLRPIAGMAAVGRSFFAERLQSLGRLTTPERRMLAVFGLAAALWVIPKPLFAAVEATEQGAAWVETNINERGLRPILRPDDSTVAILCAVLAFALPAGDGRGSRLINWETAERLPWDILLLFGAGLALALAFEVTELSQWVGKELGDAVRGQPDWVLVGAVCLVMTFLTEITSNVATCSIVLPVLAGVAVEIGVEPSLIMLPAAASASCAFMLPVATPPNAIVFGSGRLTMATMARRGFLLNLIGAAAITGLTLVWIRRMI
ncbi:DASS family sodium-coupled anion symporter [Alienimonas chondri]|uniref:Sodium-dependent dicarboxylate transporter SdcS n=1 Tax=Alienimonas chondri TaxID=2681879 RepID=A0ABX1VES8_9PLAN|nr:DASS family sodium-coupled anion symporter [Alienimonas chondri]NNJ26608.1 Sodium-dependent dicarboxylate transporter SdcS [Alienimonas chondri]